MGISQAWLEDGLERVFLECSIPACLFLSQSLRLMVKGQILVVTLDFDTMLSWQKLVPPPAQRLSEWKTTLCCTHSSSICCWIGHESNTCKVSTCHLCTSC